MQGWNYKMSENIVQMHYKVQMNVDERIEYFLQI